MTLPILLLPGMDGTGELSKPFAEVAPPQFRPIVVSLPDLVSYDALFAAVENEVPATGAFAVLGESFSGPLAIRLAARHRDRVVALILSNTFVSAPRSALLRLVPWRLLFSLDPPGWISRMSMVGRRASKRDVEDIRRTAALCNPRTMAGRMDEVLTLKDDHAASGVSCPVLCLRGTEDRLVHASSADRISRAFPRVTRVEIAGPHLLLQTRPNETWAAVQRFFAEQGVMPETGENGSR